jgi:hypothetical protein
VGGEATWRLFPAERNGVGLHVRQRLDAGVEALSSHLQIVRALTELNDLVVGQRDLPERREVAVHELDVGAELRESDGRRAGRFSLERQAARPLVVVRRIEQHRLTQKQS